MHTLFKYAIVFLAKKKSPVFYVFLTFELVCLDSVILGFLLMHDLKMCTPLFQSHS